MQDSEIEVCGKYAMREKVSVGEPLIEVQVLEKTGHRGQIKVRRLTEPHRGLEEFVKTRQFVVPWADRQAFLRDEQRQRRFNEARSHPGQAIAGAIDTVFAATGYDAWTEDDGTVEMLANEVHEMARLAGLPPDLEKLHEVAFIDRFDRMHLPLEVAEKLAQAYASAEPEIVLMYIEDQESEYKARGYEYGERYHHDLLREKLPGFALARYWAGHQEEVEMLRVEIQRLRNLVKSAAKVLEKAGQEREGWRLLRGLDGR
jgi:hypothetical protein